MTFNSAALRLNRPQRLAVMLSGGGRTLQNLCTRRAAFNATIDLVIADRDCPGLAIAQSLGIPAVLEPGEIPAPRLADILSTHRIDLVCLAGYLRLVEIPPDQRILNIHPALLPRHGGRGMHGLHVHWAVLASGDRLSGCTVHFCDDHYDRGEIVLQRTCPVLPTDTPESLAARVFQQECDAYPAALALVVGEGRPGAKA
ncbi:MAG: phosphoribosylglycinamide formyltransferase [Phycisphaeraceae bacterium]|nr:phosphoribosylglycinamide formyltransferase [Phycisphaeraceae bacterium]